MDMVTEMKNNEIITVEEPTMASDNTLTSKVKTWIDNHKMLVAIGGSVVLAAVVAILLRKMNVPEATINEIVEPLKVGNAASNQKEMINVVEEITKRQYTLPTTPFDVTTHPRKLPIGQHASPEKIAQAAMLGIDLGEHQTLVDGYLKYKN